MLLVEEALVVEATIERGTRVLHIGSATITEAIAISITTHRGQRGTCALHRHRVHLCRKVQGTHLIELVTERQTSHRKRGLHVVAGGHQLTGTSLAFLDLLHLCSGVTRLIVGGHHIDTVGEFALLTIDKGTGTQLLITCRGTQGTVIAVQALGCLRVLLIHHDIQYTGCALGIVLRTRVGHHLNTLHGGSGHALEHHRRIRREHHVGHAIHIYLEIGRTIDGDIILSIDGDHRHLTEHVEYGVRLGVLVLGHVVAHLIDLHLHQRLLGDDLHTLQHSGTLLQI